MTSGRGGKERGPARLRSGQLEAAQRLCYPSFPPRERLFQTLPSPSDFRPWHPWAPGWRRRWGAERGEPGSPRRSRALRLPIMLCDYPSPPGAQLQGRVRWTVGFVQNWVLSCGCRESTTEGGRERGRAGFGIEAAWEEAMEAIWGIKGRGS